MVDRLGTLGPEEGKPVIPCLRVWHIGLSGINGWKKYKVDFLGLVRKRWYIGFKGKIKVNGEWGIVSEY